MESSAQSEDATKENACDDELDTNRTKPITQRYGIKQSLMKHSVKYIPPKIEHPKPPEHVCSPCSKGRKVRVASNYCTVCCEKLCSDCTVQHNKFQLLAQHKMVAVSEAPKDQSEDTNNTVRFRLEEKCALHGTKIIDRYCKNHDAVGCTACMALDHRTCLEPEYISKVSSGLLKSNVPKETKQAVQDKRKSVQNVKEKRVDDKKRFHEEKVGIEAVIVDTRKKINELFDRIEREAMESLNAKYDADAKGIRKDIKRCDEAMASLDAALQRLKEANEPQLFINIKRDAMSGLSKGDTVIHTVTEHLGSESLGYTVDENINEWLSKLTGLGKFDHEKSAFVGSFYAKIDGHMESDAKKTDYVINGIVNLADGRTILADWTNRRLKMLDKSYYNTCGHCDLQGAPFAICGVGPTEIAVSIRDEKVVQFITIDDKKMTPSRRFKVDEFCRGIAHHHDEMYITCGGGDGEGVAKLRVYSTSGVLQRVYDEDKHGQKLFKAPKDVLINNEGTRIHVADRQKGIITLSIEGRYQSTFNDPALKTPYGMTLDSTGNLFVIGYDSNNVLQIGSDGKKLSQVLMESDGIEHPIAICCHEGVTSRLLISTENNSDIKVFTLQEK